MKSFCAALFVAALALAQIPVDPASWPGDSFDQYRSFVIKLDQFNRKLGGCPATGLDMSACSAASGTYDVALWRQLRKDAQQVFMLSQ
jgi:hypothetical protein